MVRNSSCMLRTLSSYTGALIDHKPLHLKCSQFVGHYSLAYTL